jgi:eukaryotic-like serine/threonine-protein kinase
MERLDSDETQPLDSASAAIHLKQIGQYRVLELLDSGGMGEVYKAERRHPIRRIVALKMIKLGFDSREVIARFESERQALARMDHPHIAKVLDAGISDTGRPYFVMEYVPGVPITKFCDDNKLSIKDRLLLFTQACDAISHAHTKMIIHRDIKAANVLAYVHEEKPEVKIVDFGIAKAVAGDRLTDLTFNTEHGRIIGTYDTMSPEQADGSPDIDSRTDVYSLGVLLYELLTGIKPFDQRNFAHVADVEIKRIIREVEPSRPSTRLTSLGDEAARLAELRQAKLESLTKQLRSELEWIPLKAMRKERARRYESPLLLKEDIENYLARKPLAAGPERATYRLRKFVQRRSLSLSMFAIVTVLLALGATLYLSRIRAEQSKTTAALLEAERKRSEAQRVRQLLVQSILDVRPGRTQTRPAEVTDLLDQIWTNTRKAFADEPLVEAEVLQTLALTNGEFDRLNVARAQAERAHQLFSASAGSSDRKTLLVLHTLGRLQDSPQASEVIFRRAYEERRRAFGQLDPDTIWSAVMLANTLEQLGKLDEAEPLAREALSARERANFEPEDVAYSKMVLARILLRRSAATEAESLLTSALPVLRSAGGDHHPDTIRCLSLLSRALAGLNKRADAIMYARQSSQLAVESFGGDSEAARYYVAQATLVVQAMEDQSDAKTRSKFPFTMPASQPHQPRTIMGGTR